MDFAEPSALPAMIQDLAEFAEICRKLSIDEEPFIRKTVALYHAYAAYLNAAEKYDDFADYLVRHSFHFKRNMPVVIICRFPRGSLSGRLR